MEAMFEKEFENGVKMAIIPSGKRGISKVVTNTDTDKKDKNGKVIVSECLHGYLIPRGGKMWYVVSLTKDDIDFDLRCIGLNWKALDELLKLPEEIIIKAIVNDGTVYESEIASAMAKGIVRKIGDFWEWNMYIHVEDMKSVPARAGSGLKMSEDEAAKFFDLKKYAMKKKGK